jgi:hypothetical protein
VGLPDQLPGDAASVDPARSTPAIVGGEVFSGASAATTAVGAERAEERPAAL